MISLHLRTTVSVADKSMPAIPEQQQSGPPGLSTPNPQYLLLSSLESSVGVEVGTLGSDSR
jgi:hypothetical protein